MTNVDKVMLKYGKVTQAEIDANVAKEKTISDALAAYTAGKTTMTKAQISACMDAIVAAKVDTKPVKIVTK